MAYQFDSAVLSAEKLQIPQYGPTVLDAYGVTIVSLAPEDAGLFFNRVDPVSGAPATVTIEGSVFTFNQAYAGSVVALIKTPVDGVVSFTLVDLTAGAPLSSGNVVIPLSGEQPGVTVWTDRQRFLRLYGYI